MAPAIFEDRLYLGTWVQRTSLHLKELYNFLRFKKGILGLSSKRINELWGLLQPENPLFLEDHNYEMVKVTCGEVDLTVTEDGVILASLPVKNSVGESRQQLEALYAKSIGPALAYLFSRGAPLPRELAEVKTVWPLLLVTKDVKRYEGIFLDNNDESYLSMKSDNFELTFGHQVHLFFIKRAVDSFTVGEFVENTTFYREFEEQLDEYLNLHRTLWEDISRIRESHSLRYRDFPLVRQRLLEYQKTLSFVKARLAQMNDIIIARSSLLSPALKLELEKLGYYRFDHLQSNQLYLAHLWEMTIEYAGETLTLLDSLFQENTQRELSALKFIALVGAITSFFGMNIAFPWEERWPAVAGASWIVLVIIVGMAVAFYGILRVFIYNRKFVIKQKGL